MSGAGYFSDGAVNVELGAHVFATPGGTRSAVRLAPHSLPAAVLASGGGVQDLEVTGQRLRANMGDAERYAYELLAALAGSGAGTLGVEDAYGRQSAFAEAVCLGAVAEVHAFMFVDVRLDFAAPERSSAASYGSPPATPGTYGGTSTLQDYEAGGVPLGDHPVAMRIELVRAFPLRQVPRARGARAVGPTSGAMIRFVVGAHVHRPTANLAGEIEALTRSIGPGKVALTGNGNTFSGVLLDSVRPAHTDLHHTALELTFVQELSA